jgi:TPR repeat protein
VNELLFKQPEGSYLGDCPICCLPLSFDKSKSKAALCCGKIFCIGCDYAFQKQDVLMGNLESKCPFCRQRLPASEEESRKCLMKRLEVDDVLALSHLGKLSYREGDYKKSFEYFSKGAELGDVEAHYSLSCLYKDGEGVEKDASKQIQHLVPAAIGNHPEARYDLGSIDHHLGKIIGNDHGTERAIKHYTIAANLGHDKSLTMLRHFFKEGLGVSKEDFAGALRGYQAAIEATKSPQREEGEKFREWLVTAHPEFFGTR